MEHTNRKETISCAGCLNDIGKDEYVSALGQDWHRDCFRCSVCDAVLCAWYFEKGGLLFCRSDYWARYGENCHHCAQVMTGPVMSAGEHRFHPECFCCVRCGAGIEDGEPYALIERSHLYCGSCYSVQQSPQSDPHSISTLPLPPRTVTVRQIDGDVYVTNWSRKLSCVVKAALQVCLHLACMRYRINSSRGILSLRIGDRILEINGTPVQNQTLDDIERTLDTDTVLQLTVEHTPNTQTHQEEVPKSKQKEEVKKQNVLENMSPVERKILKEDLKNNVTSYQERRDDEGVVKRERLFKRKGEEAGKVRVIKRRQTPQSPLLADDKRSSSLSKLLDAVQTEQPSVLRDLSRARSFRSPQAGPSTVFRPADLIQGELLGSGFFGEVYKVTHRQTGELMVLKQLYRVDENAQNNFLKEVAVLRSLNHPNVLRFVGVLYKEKRLHLVTEYVAGGTLNQLIQDLSTPLPWRLRVAMSVDICRGVGYLHRMNLIHRDLNSHNCLVREDKTVIVADFGLARLVQRTSSRHSSTRKRYTVVGNPYWMAPEMMNGNVYDEKVDIFSFGIILCEIIGRVSADPDFLPRRSDFGLNECLFREQFCAECPAAFYRIAFNACQLDPDTRPTFEVMETWLESLLDHLSTGSPTTLLADIEQFEASNTVEAECCHTEEHGECCHGNKCESPEENVPNVGEKLPEGRVMKSKSNAAIGSRVVARTCPALGKCVSASAIGHAPRVFTLTDLTRAAPAQWPGYILRAGPTTIDITKVGDITEYLDPPPPLKRTSPDSNLNNIHKTRKIDDLMHLPAFLRNQSVEGLETKYKSEIDTPITFCRHISIPSCEVSRSHDDSDSSSDEEDIYEWSRNVSLYNQVPEKLNDPPKKILSGLVKKGESLLGKKSYDITGRVENEKAEDNRRIDDIAEVKNVPISKVVETKTNEKQGFFTKNLLSPKLRRLFKHEGEVARTKTQEEKEDKSRSKFFIQRPASPSNIRSYRVRPVEERNDQSNVLKSDLKLASMGKPMTPIFRRHVPNNTDFADGRFSYRDRRPKHDFKTEPKFIDVGRNRIKTPIIEKTKTHLSRSNQTNNNLSLATVPEKKNVGNLEKPPVLKKREPAISRSNYVSLANLKINSKKDLEAIDDAPIKDVSENIPERVI